MSDWQPIGRVPFSRVARVRVQAHVAAQSLARATRSGLEAENGDAHTNLGWELTSGTLWTREFAARAIFGLDIAGLTLHGRDPHRGETELSLSGQTPAEADAWMLDRLNAIGARTESFEDALPYEVPGAETVYRFAAAGDALRELANWFEGGQRELSACAVSELGLDQDAVRCWPHHFDLGALLALEEGDAETSRSISIGMSPGDGSYDEPYFYVTPWPRPELDDLPSLSHGHWHSDGFMSAVLTGTELLTEASQDPGPAVRRFLAEAVAACRDLLA